MRVMLTGLRVGEDGAVYALVASWVLQGIDEPLAFVLSPLHRLSLVRLNLDDSLAGKAPTP